MQPKEFEQFSDILDTPKYYPCISLIMPFEPKMGIKKELDHHLKISIDNIEEQLMSSYPDDKVKPIMVKLKKIVQNLNYYTHKKSLAIFISPLVEKIFYMDMPVEEKIIIDESFEIRDLIYSKKEIHKYLLAVLSSKFTKIYLGNTTQFIRITSNVPSSVEAFKNDLPEKVANFSDENKRKELLLDKFLHHTDNGLTLLLQAYKLPLFIMGTPKTIGHFKSISHNTQHVIDYISGSFEEKTSSELHQIMEPYVADWKKIIQSKTIMQIDAALGQKKLAVGINEVWKSATQKRGKLLVVEKNFIYPAQHSSSSDKIYKYDTENKNTFYIKDAVDDVIEKVIACGGDVEFVDEGLLKNYDHIVLIEYYNEL